MKDFVLKVVFAVMVGLLVSCASAPTVANPYRPLSGISNANVIGIVQITFQGDGWKLNGEAVYVRLLEAAKRDYQGNIDVCDITWSQVRVIKSAATYDNTVIEYAASGKVVSLGGGSGRSTATGVEGALARAAEAVAENFTARSRLAIVYITAQDRSTTDYILRNSGFVIIDRSELDRVRAEQRLGASLEVDDNTAARIGRISGASIVITGRVDGEGNLRRLRLRALDTTSAQVVGTASERL